MTQVRRRVTGDQPGTAGRAVAQGPPEVAAAIPALHQSRMDAALSGVRLPLQVLAVLAAIGGLWAARDFLAPVLLALLIATALSPVVTALARAMPVWLAAAAVMSSLLGGLVMTAFALSDEAITISRQLPTLVKDLKAAVVAASPRNGVIVQLQRAVADFEAATTPASSAAAVTVVEPFNVQRQLFTWGSSAVTYSSQALLLAFFVFIVLATGDLFKRKMVRISGARLSQRRVTVEMIDEMTTQIRQFLFYQVWSGALVGAVTGLAFAGLGMAHPVLWGLVAGVMNGVPYLGPTLVLAASAAAALLQFHSVGMAVAVGMVSIVVTSIEGMVLSPLVLGRAARINTVAVFVALLFWTWLWGAAGLVLAVPLLMILKTVASRVEALAPLDELLSE